MTSGTNELLKLRKLERLTRRAFEGTDGVKATLMAQMYRGSGGPVFVSHAVMRDIHRTLDDLAEARP